MIVSDWIAHVSVGLCASDGQLLGMATEHPYMPVCVKHYIVVKHLGAGLAA